MTSKNLTKKEKEIIKASLIAASKGPFFPDWEFRTLFGLKREEVRVIAEQYPDICENKESSIEDNNVYLAINNSLNNLIGYPHRKELEWKKWIPVSKKELKEILNKWKA